MTTQLHDTGEEAIIDHFFEESLTKPASVTVGLHHDGEVSGDTTAGDDLVDSDDLAAITTEPSGAAYSRATYTFGTTDFTSEKVSGDWRATLASKSFDLSDSSGTIDAFFVVISFTSDDTGDAGTTDHLLFTGPLSQSYDLSNVDTFNLSDSALSLT